MLIRSFRNPDLLLSVPVVLGVAAFLSSPAPAAAPDPLNPVFKGVHGPFRPQFPENDQSQGPSPTYTEAERQQLIAEGKDLFFSRTAFGQQPSQGPAVFGQAVSCATCHDPALGFADGLTHLVGPVREREVATPSRGTSARREPPPLGGRSSTTSSPSTTPSDSTSGSPTTS